MPRPPSLSDYHRKRSLDRTPEPGGSMGGGAEDGDAGQIFVVQKHAATRTHYDLRLELDGVRGPPWLQRRPGEGRRTLYQPASAVVVKPVATEV